MINASRETQEVMLHVKYPKMVDPTFELETGPGWSRIIDQTTAEIYSAVTERRDQRARALRYNRALARGLAGDVKGLEHFYKRNSFGIAPSQALIDHKVTESLLSAEYESVPETYVYPHLIQVKEKFGDLRYYVERLEEDLYPLVNLAERMCRYTCEICGTPGLKRDDIGWIRVLCDHHYEIAETKQRNQRQEMLQAKETV